MSQNLFNKQSKKEEKPIHSKIKINTLADLNKLTFAQISHLKLCNFEGKLFDLALKEAKRIETEKQATPIKTIDISINCKVDYKQSVALISNLFMWNPEKVIEFFWTEGHFWRCKIPSEDFSGEIEYKYAVMEGKCLTKWEDGPNRGFNVQKLEKLFACPLYCLKVARKIRVHAQYEGKEYEYDPMTYTLYLMDVWQ